MKHHTPILRSTDDPFDTAAGTVDTKFPILQAGTYRMSIEKPEIVASSKDENVKMLVYKVKLLDEGAKAEDGTTLHPGFKFTTRVVITPSGKRDADAIKRDLATLLQAVEGKGSTTTCRQLMDNPLIIDGKVAQFKVSISKGDANFDPGNNARPLVLD